MLAVLVAVFLFAPGLSDVRDLLVKASPGWLVLAVALEALSFFSYVIMFGPIFCTGLTRRRSWQISGSELAMGSLVPASGAGGLALGAWVLHRGGMGGRRIARRSVAFFLIKSGVNFVAVAVLGAALAVGLLGPDLSLWLTALPAFLAALTIVAAAVVPRLGPGEQPDPDASRLRRWLSATRVALIDGAAEARQILLSGHLGVIAGAVGYWAFDNLVLWACFRGFGVHVALTVELTTPEYEPSSRAGVAEGDALAGEAAVLDSWSRCIFSNPIRELRCTSPAWSGVPPQRGLGCVPTML